jgi:phosphomannomutase
MHYDVVEARHVRDYVVWLRFRDGRAGEIDLEPELRGPMFEPLKAPEAFREFFVHPDFATLAWPNDADIAPEFLHSNVRLADPPTPGGSEYGESPTSDEPGADLRRSSRASLLRRRPHADSMPEISRFFGIVIAMYYDEHGRPHFHARSGGHEISVEIDGLVVRGEFSGPGLRLVLDWAELHRAELLENWDRARRGLPLIPIEPLR